MVANKITEFDLNTEVFGLRHIALRNALYHVARRRWFDAMVRWVNFLIVLAGTSVAAQLSQGQPELTIISGAVIAALGAMQLAFDWSGMGRSHEILQRRYYTLMAEIECETKPTMELCAHWMSNLTLVAADEPPMMRALDAIADNQATNALISSDIPRIRINFWQSITRHLLAHNGGKFPINENYQARD